MLVMLLRLSWPALHQKQRFFVMENGVGNMQLFLFQSTLTGESFPVTKSPRDGVYSGSTCKQGEIEAVVIATGVHTFFGKAAHLVDSTNQVGHFQKVFARGVNGEAVVLMAARAFRVENQDAIDDAIVGTLANPKESAQAGIQEVHFLPFNPTNK
ncbi:hypothetical protein CsSME_00008552 [Camellia sinensis var. sinensis]